MPPAASWHSRLAKPATPRRIALHRPWRHFPLRARLSDLVRHLEPLPVGIAVVDEDGIEAGDARPALDGRHDGGLVADLGAPGDASHELGADDALVHEVLALLELAHGSPLGHTRAGAGAAGRAVDGLV